jgi:hypothetical protein
MFEYTNVKKNSFKVQRHRKNPFFDGEKKKNIQTYTLHSTVCFLPLFWSDRKVSDTTTTTATFNHHQFLGRSKNASLMGEDSEEEVDNNFETMCFHMLYRFDRMIKFIRDTCIILTLPIQILVQKG